MIVNNHALRDRLDAIGRALDANHFDQETVDRLLAEAVEICEAQREIETNPQPVKESKVKPSTAIEQARALTAKPKPKLGVLSGDKLIDLMEADRKARERVSIRLDRTIDLQAWAESSAREIAELEQTMTEDQDWFIDLYRHDLALAQKELARRGRLERPPVLTGSDAQIDWQALIQRVKETVRLANLLEAYGVELKRHGNRYKACCPFHDDDTPSLTVYLDPGNEHYYCFGCGVHGDAITFIEQTRQLRFLEAVKWLAEDYSLLPV